MNDIAYIITWWLYLVTIGITSIPLTWFIFRRLAGFSYGMGKSLGILVISYFVFLMGITKILPFSVGSIYFVSIIYVSVNLCIAIKNKHNLLEDIKNNKRVIFLNETVFAIGLLLWTYIRGHQPDIFGLEKFMDFGFVTSILRSKYLPPADMWYVGGSINYYWFGHFMTALLTKLTRIPSAITYNLMLGTILGLSMQEAFSLVTSLVSKSSKKLNIKIAFAAGIISLILLNFGGNFQTAFFYSRQYVCAEYLYKTVTACSEERVTKKYWYPDATRFIGYDPDVNDKTIHEFPLYSYVVADLHAHLLNLPLVLLYLAFLFNFSVNHTKNKSWKSVFDKWQYLFPLGLLIGVFFMTNAWDTANYLLVTGTTFAIFTLYHEFRKKQELFAKFFNAFLKSVYFILVICLFAFFAALPFLIHFKSITQGVAFVNSTTPLWQLAVLWGFPAILTFIYFYTLAKNSKITKIELSDLFVISILTSSWILIFIPEIVYVKDIYIASHHRANTMFKLTYQAFVMTYLSSGYIVVRTLQLTKSLTKSILLCLVFMATFYMILIYPQKAIPSYYGKNYKGLNGETWLALRYPYEYNVIKWFNSKVSGQPTILEAQGDSYTDFNVISSYTGLPTINGWYVHEWLWRGDSSFPQKRSDEVRKIYTSTDLELTKRLLQEYGVDYVIVGNLERQKYPNLIEDKFIKLGNIVFSSGNVNVYKLF